MQTYETQKMTRTEAYSFVDWFDETIGTEYEINQVGAVEAYVMAFDMLPIEIGLCRAWEQSHIPAPTNKDVKLGRVDVQGWVL